MPRELQRFPRASLISDAAEFDSRLSYLMDGTFAKLQEAIDLNIPISVDKLQQRFDQLELCRHACNELRQRLWDLR